MKLFWDGMYAVEAMFIFRKNPMKIGREMMEIHEIENFAYSVSWVQNPDIWKNNFYRF